ncbi:hypothetical protein ASPVEDRAFT_144601 [Aspergillus versicolor CBS 583.65]|uniref:Uncharacterized protein n=1 Tax=Aspergillus versicolor CBS 583.65 TaxID=1036611 RepID=A0A1L9Q425_ASPVE|nr:uncharacterized protein ASPVEDRAFT_144601 [Aspergillus versicolor CBS 583.65]OJJ08479.1 hypothetical protein ASPVEDRAFT_144601 [Aspergillus versicolor CBS 583.65]
MQRRAEDRGNSTVSGLGARKQEIIAAGGTSQDLSIAMLETDEMTTDYTYGDGKTGDSTNFGIFKQNWMMLRTSASQFEGLFAADVDQGAVLNKDLAADITARHESEKHYGYTTWCAGHRNGDSGLKNPNTDDIDTYKTAIEWIQEQIDSDEKYLTDDTRFWVDVTAI